MTTRCHRFKEAKDEWDNKSFEDKLNCFKDYVSLPEESTAKGRKRIFFFPVTFWLFLVQLLTSDCSCMKILISAMRYFAIKEKDSLSTSAYCQSRRRLKSSMLWKIFDSIIKKSDTKIPSKRLWFGRHVKVVDGTVCSMPDTSSNQKAYPQVKSQKPGCGFPKIRLVAVFSLVKGIMLHIKSGHYRQSERSLFRVMMNEFHKGDVILADRGFSSYVDMASLYLKGVDFVIRAKRTKRRGDKLIKRYSINDRVIRWTRPRACPRWMSKEEWGKIPRTLDLRFITYTIQNSKNRTGKVTVITSLTSRDVFPMRAFSTLYKKRWKVELFFKDIKETMGMGDLKCKTPEMIEKEILMYCIGYNLIRLTIYQSAVEADLPIERISFKGALQVILELGDLYENGFSAKNFRKIIASLKVPKRPGRKEPRAIKQRLKRYQLLTKHRHLFEEDHHRGKRPNS